MKFTKIRTIKYFRNISLKLNKLVMNDIRTKFYDNVTIKLNTLDYQNKIFNVLLNNEMFMIPLKSPKIINFFE